MIHKPYIGTEAQFQQSVAHYLDSLGVLWMHPANERKTTPQAGARLKRAGVKPGVPDVLIFECGQDTTTTGYTSTIKGLAIELKVGKNKTSPEQRSWLERLENRGWAAQ